jgi:hypothetical protein
VAFDTAANQKTKESRPDRPPALDNSPAPDFDIHKLAQPAETNPAKSNHTGCTNQAVLRMLQRDRANDMGEHETDGMSAAPPIVHDVLETSGRPLDSVTRESMEPRFGRNFGDVRIHTDAKAAESATAVNARAYTVGQDIVFGHGQYSPGSSEGQKTIAHELTHTVQQGGGMKRIPDRLEVSSPSDALEREASAVADGAMDPKQIGASSGSANIARDDVSAPAPAPPVSPPSPPPPAKKKVTVNITILNGATHSVADAIKYANDKVYSQAWIEVVKGKEETLDEAKSKAILGDDLVLEEYDDVTKPTTEEKALFKLNQVAGEIAVYFVKKQSQGNTGESFLPSSGVGFVGSVYTNAGNDSTFSHEIGHVLLDSADHTVPDNTYLMYASKNAGKYKLTPDQITKIKASSFVK